MNHLATLEPIVGGTNRPHRLDLMEDSMSLKTIPYSSLLPLKGNPRRSVDTTLIASLAQSIRADGVLQNLVVQPVNGKYRIISGQRRYLALQLLKKEKVIDGDYKIPVEVKKDLTEGDAVRLATVENVQREQLQPDGSSACGSAEIVWLSQSAEEDQGMEQNDRNPHQVYRRITEQIAAAIATGAPQFEMPWHRSGPALSRPLNAVSGNAYHGINVLALWVAAQSRGFGIGIWATYRQWNTLHAQVRKGENRRPLKRQ